MAEKLGNIVMNAKGLRKLADAMDMIYTPTTIIRMPVWKDEQELLFFQLADKTGEINLVDK